MDHRWAAPLLALGLCLTAPGRAVGQGTAPRREHGAKGKITGNFPNPFNPDTYLKFTVGADSCAPGSHQFVVTLQVVNVLAQPVAVPVLHGFAKSAATPSTIPPAASATPPTARTPVVPEPPSLPEELKLHPLRELKLGCGNYVAYWDGKLPNGHLAAAGVYGVLLTVDGSQQDSFKIYYKK